MERANALNVVMDVAAMSTIENRQTTNRDVFIFRWNFFFLLDDLVKCLPFFGFFFFNG